MPGKLSQIWFAAVLACAGLPALAAEMPDSGTKNFVPGGDAPAFFTNENGAVAAAAADESTADDGADQSLHSPRSAPGPIRDATVSTRRHGKLAASHTREQRTAANSRERGRAPPVASRKGARAASAGKPAGSTRTASRAAVSTRPMTAKVGGAHQARQNARHAAAKSVARRG
jgi:hypothetical protein